MQHAYIIPWVSLGGALVGWLDYVLVLYWGECYKL
jgi:hypothetical protein